MANTTEWMIHPLFVSQRGNKSAPITYKQPIRAPIKFFVRDTITPFKPSAWVEGEKRVTLDLQITPEAEEFCKALDKFVLDTVSQDPQAFFKKTHTYDELKAMYTSPIREHEKVASTIRTKMDLGSVRYWTKDGAPTYEPSDWRKAALTVCVTVKGLWFNAGGFGCTLECFDVQVEPHDCSCPFGN
jgi:hypothetical protein